jgi:hypothetical protein
MLSIFGVSIVLYFIKILSGSRNIKYMDDIAMHGNCLQNNYFNYN